MSRTLNLRRSVVLGGVAVIISLIGIKSFAGEDWELITKIPTKRKDFSTAVVNGEIYLIGGNLFGNRKGPFGMSLVEIYNPEKQ